MFRTSCIVPERAETRPNRRTGTGCGRGVSKSSLEAVAEDHEPAAVALRLTRVVDSTISSASDRLTDGSAADSVA
ncbi:MAG: hypothetical protein WBY94_13750, partial [Polyangiaceae bacterium]